MPNRCDRVGPYSQQIGPKSQNRKAVGCGKMLYTVQFRIIPHMELTMNVMHSQQAIGWPAATIEIGKSTWENGTEGSIRLRFNNSKGGFNRQSPEVPQWALPELLEAAIQQGFITKKLVAEILARNL
jgi:hypothetical protein